MGRRARAGEAPRRRPYVRALQHRVTAPVRRAPLPVLRGHGRGLRVRVGESILRVSGRGEEGGGEGGADDFGGEDFGGGDFGGGSPSSLSHAGGKIALLVRFERLQKPFLIDEDRRCLTHAYLPKVGRTLP